MEWTYSLPQYRDSPAVLDAPVGDKEVVIHAHFEENQEPHFFWVARVNRGSDGSVQCPDSLYSDI